jgi:PAS domain S-box-containing protein
MDQQINKSIAEYLQFERLISDLSARFVNIAPEQVDGEVENGLMEILKFFQVDRCGLVCIALDEITWQVTHAAFAEGIPRIPLKTDFPVSLFPWIFKQVVEKNTVVAYSTIEELPPQADIDKQTYRDWGILSNINIPIALHANAMYVFTINSMRCERVWPEEYIPRLRLLGEIFVNALVRAQTRLQMEEHLQMERLLAAHSRRFLNVPAEQVEEEIEGGLQEVAEFLGVERGSLAQRFDDHRSIIVTHSWAAPGFEKITGVIASAEMPWICHNAMRGETVACERLDDLPDEAVKDKNHLQATGTLSSIFIPLLSGGEIFGYVCFESLKLQKNWPDKLVRLLRVVAQILTNALVRRRAFQDLRESEARLNLAAASANAGLWVVNLANGHVWITEKTRELFGFPPGLDITFDYFLTLVHPEDRELVRQTVQQAIVSKENVNAEYRAVLSDGSIRWMNSQGRAFFKGTGEPDHITGVTLDITERKKLHDHLLSVTKEWQSTFDSVQDLIMILDTEFRIQKVNTSTVSFFNLPVSQILGRSCTVLMHGTESCITECPASRAFQTRQHQETEVFDSNKNIWLLVTADPILDALGGVTGVVHVMKDISARKEQDRLLQNAYDEIKQLRDQLEAENIYLRQESEKSFEQIIGQSSALNDILYRVKQVAATDSTVLITGETGTGKELIAQAIHNLSSRHSRLMVKVNCAALPAGLIESELFGREKGAYTGALSRQIGRFELANASTLFLDEITELPLDLQAKLLRALESGEFERLGSPKTIRVNVRLIASTNRDIAAEVRRGAFREDLYYRLKVFPIEVPPLRERIDDVPLLVQAFVTEFAEKMGKKITSVPKKIIDAMQRYHWPGNIRELRNVIEQSLIISSGGSLQVNLPQTPAGASFKGQTLEEKEYQHILEVLSKTGWRIKGLKGAAELLGLKPSTLYTKMNKLGIPNQRQIRRNNDLKT